MTSENTNMKQLPKTGTYAFVVALLGAAVLLLTSIGMNLAAMEAARRLLAWLSAMSMAVMIGGIIVFLYFVAREIIQNR